MWVVSFTPRPLYPLGKIPWYPLDRRLGGPQSRSGRRGEEEIFDPTRTRAPARSRSLYWLRYPGSPYSSFHWCSAQVQIKWDGSNDRNDRSEQRQSKKFVIYSKELILYLMTHCRFRNLLALNGNWIARVAFRVVCWWGDCRNVSTAYLMKLLGIPLLRSETSHNHTLPQAKAILLGTTLAPTCRLCYSVSESHALRLRRRTDTSHLSPQWSATFGSHTSVCAQNASQDWNPQLWKVLKGKSSEKQNISRRCSVVFLILRKCYQKWNPYVLIPRISHSASCFQNPISRSKQIEQHQTRWARTFKYSYKAAFVCCSY
jgi:hypothetical protein